ncbi:MAG TPA: hypothetical protein VFA93_00440 [Patescibacteria group bacterium]|nr:hypothetical protein [Patescibacteria group bacterium]
MAKERVLLSTAAVLIGLLVAAVAFYLYQGTRGLSINEQQGIAILKPTPTPKPRVLLVLDQPEDESIADTRVVKISGKTEPDALIVIITSTDYDVINPTPTGDFSTTVTIDNGENLIRITAVSKSGETNTIERTVSYTTESF